MPEVRRVQPGQRERVGRVGAVRVVGDQRVRVGRGVRFAGAFGRGVRFAWAFGRGVRFAWAFGRGYLDRLELAQQRVAGSP